MDFEEFKKEFQKVPVEHLPNQAPANPLVSVCVFTYQHEKYIKECLDGILMQEVNFEYEILLLEDQSSDGTREICLGYASKHPEIIKLILNKRENNILINGNPTGRFNILYGYFFAKGKYIAVCEGDDYWVDPLKLSKQVSVLENCPEIVVCHHWQKYKYEDKEIDAPTENQGYYPCEVASVREVFLNQLRVKSRTMMFRNLVDGDFFPDWFNTVAFGDVLTVFLLGRYGKFFFINEPMAVYRQTGKGMSSAGKDKLSAPRFTEQHFKSWIEIWDHANVHYNYEFQVESIKTINEFYSIILKKNRYSVFIFLNLIFHSLFSRTGSILKKLPSTVFLIKTLVNKKLNFAVLSKVKKFIFR